MTDDTQRPARQKRGFRTTLSHVGRGTKREHGFVNPPLLRGSTVLVPTVAERQAMRPGAASSVLTYGTGGSATHWALEDAMAAIEGGTRCYIVSTGLAAVTTPLLAWLRAGDHLLMPDHVYGPARNFASTMLRKFGVETTYYPPEVDEAGDGGADAAEHQGRYTESPGSHTFEVPGCAGDRPGRACRRGESDDGQHLGDPSLPAVHPRGGRVDPGGNQISRRALGRADRRGHREQRGRLAGAARGRAHPGAVCQPGRLLADLRGIRTLAVRLRAQMESALQIAHWLRQQPEVAQVLHPACRAHRATNCGGAISPAHAACSGSSSRRDHHRGDAPVCREAGTVRIGASWGGYESLAVPTTGFITRTAGAGHVRRAGRADPYRAGGRR